MHFGKWDHERVPGGNTLAAAIGVLRAARVPARRTIATIEETLARFDRDGRFAQMKTIVEGLVEEPGYGFTTTAWNHHTRKVINTFRLVHVEPELVGKLHERAMAYQGEYTS